MKVVFHLLMLMLLIFSCKNAPSSEQSPEPVPVSIDTPEEVVVEVPEALTYDTTEWRELIDLDPSILLDIKYATADNFVEEKMYDCGKCFLRPEVARAMVKAQAMLREQGYGLLMYDCYRPKPFQQKLWDKVPDPRYVSPPGSGSMHGRGLAVDLTLVDAEGNLMDMGTGYDFFGERAYQTFEDLPSDVLANRKLLNKTMEAVGLSPIRTEWWHFSMRGLKYEGSDWVWPCP